MKRHSCCIQKLQLILHLQGLSSVPLKNVDTFSISSTNNNLFSFITIFYATANPSQTLYQPHTYPNVQTKSFRNGPSAKLRASSAPTVSPLNFPPVSSQN